MKVVAATVAVLMWAVPALADPFPASSGETGLLDVPVAEGLPPGSAAIGASVRADHHPGDPLRFGPSPLNIVTGLVPRLEAGMTARQGGVPGDGTSGGMIFGVAAKLTLAEPDGLAPGLALDGIYDRVNQGGVAAMRGIVSMGWLDRVRVAAMLGVEQLPGPGLRAGLTGGAAVSLVAAHRYEVVADGLFGPRGPAIGAALHFRVTPRTGLSVGATWLPRENGFSIAIGFGAGGHLSEPAEPIPAPPTAQEAPAPVVTPDRPAFRDERPHLRLRIRAHDTGDAHDGDAPPQPAAAPPAPPPPIGPGGASGPNDGGSREGSS